MRELALIGLAFYGLHVFKAIALAHLTIRRK